MKTWPVPERPGIYWHRDPHDQVWRIRHVIFISAMGLCSVPFQGSGVPCPVVGYGGDWGPEIKEPEG